MGKSGCSTVEPVGDDSGDEELKESYMSEQINKTTVASRKSMTLTAALMHAVRTWLPLVSGPAFAMERRPGLTCLNCAGVIA